MEVTVRAWRAGSGHLRLGDIFDAIGQNDWQWRLEEFVGVTRSGSGIDAVELEARVLREGSVAFTWDGLLALANQVDQLIDGRLMAYVAGDGRPVFVLEALDSTFWKVTASDGEAPAVAAVARVAALES